MADVKITELPVASNISDSDELILEQGSGTKRVTRSNLSDKWRAGDVISHTSSGNNFMLCDGQLVNSTTVRFTIPLCKPVEATSISFTTLTIYLRTTSGTIVSNTNVATNTSYSIATAINVSGICVNLTIPTTTATTNTPVSILINAMSGTFA